MNLNLFAYSSLSLALALVVISGIAETVITRQVLDANYRYVRFIKLLRATRLPSIACVTVFILTTLWHAPLLAITALICGIAGVLLEGYITGYYHQVLWRIFLPVLLLTDAAFNLRTLHPQNGVVSMDFSPTVLLPGVAIAIGFRFIAHQRTEQGVLAWRD